MRTSIRHPLHALLVAGALAFAGPATLAQDSADPVDPLEDAALREEARARFDAALDGFRAAFDTAVRQAAGGGEGRVRNLSRAEVLVEKIDSLTKLQGLPFSAGDIQARIVTLSEAN